MLFKVVSAVALLALPSCLNAAIILDDFEVGAVSKSGADLYYGNTQTGLSTSNVFGGSRRFGYTYTNSAALSLTLSPQDDAMRFSTVANSRTMYTMIHADNEILNLNAIAGTQRGVVFDVKSAPAAGVRLAAFAAELPVFTGTNRRASGGVMVDGPGTYYIPFDEFAALPGEVLPNFEALDALFSYIDLLSAPAAYNVEISEIRIDAMPIPEPAALAFAGLVGAGLLARRRRSPGM